MRYIVCEFEIGREVVSRPQYVGTGANVRKVEHTKRKSQPGQHYVPVLVPGTWFYGFVFAETCGDNKI